MKNIKLKNNIIHIHQLGFPINLEIIIPKDDSVRTLYEVTEGLNYSKLYETYSTEGRNPMILPETLFRIVAYGYMEGIYSSRKLEKACKRDINFRWLLQGQKEPSHNTIARFRSKRLEECVEDLFSQFIIELEKRNEIEFENLFVDGTKIEANANRYSFVWKKATDKFEEKLQNKMHEILLDINSELNLKLDISDEKISVEYALAVKDKLIEIKEKEGLDFVYGKGKRKSSLQKYTETISDFIEKQSKYDEYKEKVKELEKELQTRKDTFEKMTEPLVYVCDCYQKFNVVTGMPKSTFGDSFGYAMQKEISDYMQDFYAGKVSREDLDSYFEKCCTSMRTYRTGQHQTSGTNEADNTQIVSECQFNSSRAIY